MSSPDSQRSVQGLSGLRPFLRPYAGHIVAAALALLAAALTTLLVPAALRQLIDQGMAHADAGNRAMAMRGHFMLLFGAGVALAVFSAARYFMVTWLGERVTADLRTAVYSHVLEQSPEFFETTQTGEVLSRLTADTTLVQTVVGSSLSLGLLVLVVLPAVWFGRRVRKLSRASQDRLADSSAIAAEVLNAIPVVQSYTQEQLEAQRFDDATERTFQTAVRRIRARSVLVAFIISATFAGLLWGLYEGTQAVMRGEITAGHLGQTVFYVIILLGSVAVLAEVWGDLQRAAAATERLMELLAARSPIQSPEQPQALPAVQAGSSVRLHQVEFRYPSRPLQTALHSFSLTVRPGETVALVGPSGAGKSTVFQLLLRFYNAQGGSVEIDGVDVKRASLAELRRRIGIVPQDSVVFSTSALENIRYGRPEASDDEVFAAARAAHADGFLRALPEGYHTFLGERGVRLSGGQRQRISIARAILKNAPLLLLDEATSALDTESERAVQAALEEAMRDRTTLVIAHRLSTVINADRIAVLDHGGLVDIGTHAELLARCELYANLAAAQFDAPLDTAADTSANN